jgi:REP element-mobilizing transposase RayT
MFRYIWGIIKNKKSHLYRIGGVEDHIHIFTDIHQTICVADFVKDIKIATSKWVKHPRIFRNFTNWQDGYGAFTVSRKEKNNLIEYIKNQEHHHNNLTFREEYKRLLLEAGIEFDEKHLL